MRIVVAAGFGGSMHHFNSSGALISLLELAVPFYGLRLTRRFGTRQIGWALVVAFGALALVRLTGLELAGVRAEWGPAWTLVCVLVPVLLLIGMAHMETVFNERGHVARRTEASRQAVRAVEMPEIQPNWDVMANVAVAAAQHFNRHLGIINLYANLLRQKSFDPKIAEQHRRIAEEAAQAAALGKRLLCAGRTPASRHEPVNINKLVTDSVAGLREMFGTRVNLEHDFRKPLPHVMANPAQLRFVLEQLVKNAAEASPVGGTVRLTAGIVRAEPRQFRAHECQCAGRFLRVAVSDSGSGMDDEVKRHIFEPFYTTKDRTRHAGLGLASVYGLVKEHGGWVQVQTNPGAGTSVEIFLPLAG